MKKIIFCDADGTLWYPRKTKRKEDPSWVWKHGGDMNKLKKELMLIPTVFETIKKLRKKGIKFIVLSRSPHPPEKGDAIVAGIVKHFNLHDLFDEVHATRDFNESKEAYILDILKKYNLSKKDALMVGDSYPYDYKGAKKIGVDAVFVDNDYSGLTYPNANKIKRKIRRFEEILKYI